MTPTNISKKRKDIAFVWVGPDEGKAEEVKEEVKSPAKKKVSKKK